MASKVNIIQDNVNQLRTRFDNLRDGVLSQLNECNDCIRTAEKLCKDAIELNPLSENKLTNASYEKKEWKNIKFELTTTAIKGKVILDVGGDKFITSVDTLTREKDTYFTTLFSEQWELVRDPDDKSIFIDRNGKIFTYILEYLRTNVVPNNVMKDDTLIQSLLIEAEYFRLHSLITILSDIHFPNGTLLQPEHKKKLNEFYGNTNQRWELIYKASRDGFDANAFHSRCNNKGPTMTIIQSNGKYLVGGYTAVPWTSDGSYKNDPTAFLFTLTNPRNIPPSKYLIQSADIGDAVYDNSSDDPTFDADHSIHLANVNNVDSFGAPDFTGTYIDTVEQSNNNFTEAKNYTTSDIEVFKLA